MDKLNLCIVSGRYPASSFESVTNHKIYANTYGYDYIYCGWPTKASSPYKNKFVYLKSVIPKYDYVFWIDDDAFFFDLAQDILEFLPEEGQFLSVCRSPDFKDLKTFISSGQFWIKNSPVGLQFIDEVLRADLSAIKRWWKPGLGFFSNGDQDAMIYLMLTQHQYEGYKIYDYKFFNSRADNLMGTDPHNVFLLHFTGTKDKKQKDYRHIQKLFNLHPSLVSWELLNEYRIKKEDSGLYTLLKSCYRDVRKILKKLSK